MAGQPKGTFYFAILLVIAGLVGLAVWRTTNQAPTVSPTGAAPPISAGDLAKASGAQAEAADSAGITTVKEYDFVAAQRLPEIKGVSSYKPMQARTVRFAINVWAGWAPIIFANGGFKPGQVWHTPSGKDFKVELVLIDDPVAMRDAFAAGNVHVGWATVDMLPLLIEGLAKDSRTMPRVFQQIDWSNGGDGIVVRDSIKTIADLRGKRVVLAQNSPSHFFLLNALINAGVQPSEVEFKFTGDAFQAAAAFNADKSIAGCVSWAPDIYNLQKVAGNKLMVTTATANKLIADVWFARADFAKDNADVVDGLVRGIFDAMAALSDQGSKVKVAGLMADGYSLAKDEALGMLGDAHWTNYAENRGFFLNQNNPTNFERTYDTAHFLYRRIGAVGERVDYDRIMDFTLIQALGKVPKYAQQKDEYAVQFAPSSAGAIQAESTEILTKTVVIHFFPNSWDLHHKVETTAGCGNGDCSGQEGGKASEAFYDPNVDYVIEEIGKLAGQYGAARVVIEGHTDSSMRNQIPDELVKELAANRANSVKQELTRKFPTLQPNQFAASGVGWDRPADPNDPNNHAKNRRVEVKVYPLEAVSAK